MSAFCRRRHRQIEDLTCKQFLPDDGKKCTCVPFSDLALVVYIIQIWSQICSDPCLMKERTFHLQSMENHDLTLAISVVAFLLAPGLRAAQQTGTSALVVPPNASDRLTREVRHELVTQPYYGVFDDLSYAVSGSVVTLYGRVTKPALKSEAEDAVKRIEGVSKVDDQIKVLPLSSMDDQIRRTEYRAIYSLPGLDMYAMRAVPSIHIIVESGHVTLEGAVASQADKNLAGVAANGVSGVFSLDNNLRVDRR
jgi:hyperosmotically inducible protein